MRVVASGGAALLALLLLVLAITTPRTIRDAVSQDVRYQQQFRAVAGHAMSHLTRTGRLPDDQQLQRWAEGKGFQTMAFSLTTRPVGCENFIAAAGDRFTLGFWRGERGECYSAPSGKTTLLLSRERYAPAGMAFEMATMLLLSGLLASAAWWLWPLKRPKLIEASR